jgi:hypothetical protein
MLPTKGGQTDSAFKAITVFSKSDQVTMKSSGGRRSRDIDHYHISTPVLIRHVGDSMSGENRVNDSLVI